jgi:hypothetical protein
MWSSNHHAPGSLARHEIQEKEKGHQTRLRLLTSRVVKSEKPTQTGWQSAICSISPTRDEMVERLKKKMSPFPVPLSMLQRLSDTPWLFAPMGQIVPENTKMG